jgi:hypothetical protein
MVLPFRRHWIEADECHLWTSHLHGGGYLWLYNEGGQNCIDWGVVPRCLRSGTYEVNPKHIYMNEAMDYILPGNPELGESRLAGRD